MSVGARIAAFVALLAVVFAGAALAGGALDPGAGADGATPHGQGATTPAASATSAGSQHMASGHGSATATATPAGLASADGGYRLVADTTRFRAGRPAPLRLRILDAAGATVRDFDVEQARRMHLIVVRRDLRFYQHLHPVQGTDGAWTLPDLTLPHAGVYRAFADFRTDGAQHTLGVDLFASGDFAALALPGPSERATTDGYDVTLHEHPGEIGFLVRRDGAIVGDLQPYLGARGHLVVLREGDLAFQHVHPRSTPPPELAFELGSTQPGTYRLFLQFRHAGRVHTAAFTVTR
jgi:hypothetical protein